MRVQRRVGNTSKEFYPGGPQDVDDLLIRVVDALSIRDYNLRGLSGHQQFFSTFSRFYQASAGRLGDMLAEVTDRAARQNIGYLELMHSPGMIAASIEAERKSDLTLSLSGKGFNSHQAIRQIAKQAIAEIDEMEEKNEDRVCKPVIEKRPRHGCSCRCSVSCASNQNLEMEQDIPEPLLAFILMELDDRVVGLNFVAPEIILSL